MSGNKKTDMFAKLAAQQARPVQDEPVEASDPATDVPPPSPTPPPIARSKSAASKPKAVKPRGKRDDPDYCQANGYLPKSLRKAVEKAILDVDGLDYSSLVEDLLRKWLKSRGVSE
jgi:hypothetical protein